MAEEQKDRAHRKCNYLEVIAEFRRMRNFCAGAREGEWVSSAKAEKMKLFDKTHFDTRYGY